MPNTMKLFQPGSGRTAGPIQRWILGLCGHWQQSWDSNWKV